MVERAQTFLDQAQKWTYNTHRLRMSCGAATGCCFLLEIILEKKKASFILRLKKKNTPPLKLISKVLILKQLSCPYGICLHITFFCCCYPGNLFSDFSIWQLFILVRCKLKISSGVGLHIAAAGQEFLIKKGWRDKGLEFCLATLSLLLTNEAISVNISTTVFGTMISLVEKRQTHHCHL